MKTSAGLLTLLLFVVSQAFALPEADLTGFRTSVLPLLDRYCMDCHDADTKKGSFDLENLAPNMLSDDDALEQWLSLIHTPSPRDKRQSRMPSSA